MNKILRNSVLILVFITSFVRAQDIHLTQFYANPLHLNPALTGANVCSRITLSYRDQWPGINKVYRTYLVSGDHYFQQYNVGAGMLIARDVAGTGSLKTTLIHPSIAYEAKLSRDFGMRFGLQPGFTMRSVDFTKLTFGDQLETGSGTTIETQKPNVAFFDLGTGIFAYTSKYWAGLSVFHVNKPNQSLLESEDAILPVKYSVQFGGKFILNEDNKSQHLRSISPVIHYRGQKKFDQLDLGFYVTEGVLNVGVWYRGIPIKPYKPGYGNNDAIAVLLGAKTDRFNVGYSYDFTISKLAGASKGAHEFNISYQFCKPKKKKKRIEVACPKF